MLAPNIPIYVFIPPNIEMSSLNKIISSPITIIADRVDAIKAKI